MANEKRLDLIERKKLFNDLADYWGIPRDWDGLMLQTCEDALSMIENAPTVDAVEVVHGRWKKSHIAGYLKCNKCEDAFIFEEWLESGKWSYCPNCGAKMDRGEET